MNLWLISIIILAALIFETLLFGGIIILARIPESSRAIAKDLARAKQYNDLRKDVVLPHEGDDSTA